MDSEILILLIGVLIFGAFLWKSGIGLSIVSGGAERASKITAWLTDEHGNWAPLFEKLDYRDFYDDVFETRDGYFWTGIEIRPVASDGFSHRDWNRAGEELNNCFAGLPAGTIVHVVHDLSTEGQLADDVYTRLAARCADPVWRTLIWGRQDYFRAEAKRAATKEMRSYIFFGRKREKGVREKISLRGFWKPQVWIDLEEKEILSLRADIMRARDSFIGYFRTAGGAARVGLKGREAFEQIYARLNPERARRHDAPAYDLGKAEGEKRIPLSPRELLCFTSGEIMGSHIKLGNRFVTAVSLGREASKMMAGELEMITRNPDLNFSFTVSAHFKVGDWFKEDRALENRETYATRSIEQAKIPSKVERKQLEQLESIRNEIIDSDEKIGDGGLVIAFESDSLDQAEDRAAIVIAAMRKCHSMDGMNDRHAALNQWLSTLPGQAVKDIHQKKMLSRDAMSLCGLTGAPSGVRREEAIAVFHRADGGIFPWNQVSADFNSGIAIIVGESGSGKSALKNLLLAHDAAAGSQIFGMDYGGSSSRLVVAAGGDRIDVTDPRRTRGLGLFSNVIPRAGDNYLPEELTEEGLARDRLSEVEQIFETLCGEMSQAQIEYLHQGIRRTYENKCGQIPTIDDFVRTFRLAGAKDRAKGEEIAARLGIFTKGGSLGRFLNEEGTGAGTFEALSPFTYFDFSRVADKRMMMIASMAVASYLGRFLQLDRQISKRFFVDELHVLADHPETRRIIDLAFRTARKANAQCLACSQDPRDFERPELRAIRINAEVFWLFHMPKEIAQTVFGLNPGVAQLIGKLKTGGSDFREVCLIYPNGGVAHLRIKFDPLTGRICAGASQGREPFTASMALDALRRGEDAPERLHQAIWADALTGRLQLKGEIAS